MPILAPSYVLPVLNYGDSHRLVIKTDKYRNWSRNVSLIRGGEIAPFVKDAVGYLGDRGTNPVTAVIFSCAEIHFLAVYNLTASSKASSSHYMPIWFRSVEIP